MSLRIAINAQLIPTAGAGGTQTVLIGLVHALGELDGPEEYVLIAPWKEKEPDWLKPFVGENQSIVRGPKMQAVKRIVIHTENTIRRPPSIIHVSTHSRRPAGNRFSCVRKPKSLAGEDGFRRAVELVRFVEHPEALVPLGDESDVRVVMTKVLHT